MGVGGAPARPTWHLWNAVQSAHRPHSNQRTREPEKFMPSGCPTNSPFAHCGPDVLGALLRRSRDVQAVGPAGFAAHSRPGVHAHELMGENTTFSPLALGPLPPSPRPPCAAPTAACGRCRAPGAGTWWPAARAPCVFGGSLGQFWAVWAQGRVFRGLGLKKTKTVKP